FTLYGAGDLRAAVLHNDALASRGPWVAAANGLYTVSRALGLAQVREALDGLFAPMKVKAPSVDGRWAQQPPEPPATGGAKPVGGPRPPPAGALAIPGRPPPGVDGADLRVLLVGASSMQYYLGSELERRLESYRGVVTHRFGKLGTGLARPDNFDWPQHLGGLLKSFRPHLVIGQFGGNDAQPLLLPEGGVLPFGSEGWDAEYTRRVRGIVDDVRAHGAGVMMLGMPVTRHPKLSERLKHVNEVTQRATEGGGGIYFSTWDAAADGLGIYRATITHEGKTGPMYLGDGVHYARLGAAYVAQRLSWRLERYLQLTPEDDARAVALRLELESTARGKVTPYLAYVPQTALRRGEKLPVLYLLHGSGGSWTDFSEQAHEALQTLATQHRLVLVTPDGDPDGWYVDGGEGKKIDTFIARELLPEVAKKLPVSDRRGVAGISMGGNGALALALRYPGSFASASAMSGAVDLTEAKTRGALVERLGPYEKNPQLWETYSATHLVKALPELVRRVPILLTVGNEDGWAPANRTLSQELSQIGGVHLFKETPGGHTWDHWLRVLPEHVAWHARQLHGPSEQEATR
ncbi:MAG TPA: DUF459 domain-containing protein, partial [Myxococcaceae bacterium]|nr:DUF459 domain-containing protein [Myxococcaceae bacterium]